MCGIVGIVGNQNAKEILLTGLEKLEYRGYDSAGIFVSESENEGQLIKAVGRIANLREKVSADVNGTAGIGHTRWATHGVPSETNAHPHTSSNERFVLVHNGVIENYEEIKTDYLAGVNLIGETDTEVAIQLINVLAEKENLSAKEAFKKALTIIKGSYAFAMMESNQPEVIYVAKNKSPLLIGLGDSFNVVCSDAMAMITETKEFVEIMDGELVIVEADKITIENQAGETINRDSYEAKIDVADMDKGTYEHYMLKEVDEQPAVMRRLVQEYTNEKGELVVDEAITSRIQKADRIYIVACGTSWHAGLVGKQLIEKVAEIPVEVHVASEFAYNMPLISKNPFFIFISQSGETADSRQVLVRVNELGYESMTMTNVPGSTLSREANHTMLLHAGPEIAVASTKAYTAQIATLAILAKATGMVKGTAVAKEFNLVKELSLVATGMERLVGEKEHISDLVKANLETTRNAFYIGRGMDYFVSMEAALKLKEISYIQAEGFAAGELKHGTIALIEEGTPVIGIITDEVMGSHTRGNLKEVESRGAATVVVSMEGFEKEGDHIVLPHVHELLTPLVSVVPIQLIAYYASLHRGLDVDKPRNLAKSVTVE
ncbi:glutamine--fructose-6-phosphate transaminase (isomerizing) [Vagococcus coleopterorum]|uniref:Glutamine--fructose-6-phosphate aminotransferase [isomerizing] n=1 Tax=Vagococcus coleopterorum TaxID=2714946 RepID=A0A6G8AN45_9ENTE|nr:glutamine--fructose-6-phosphate transaminase (isomerizing) [Vagococcus coleopterorum]QIL46389.1 glutamine--fructose-6-phosphate transaminase (isomerizing) [Vagococcus coleopterorum]